MKEIMNYYDPPLRNKAIVLILILKLYCKPRRRQRKDTKVMYSHYYINVIVCFFMTATDLIGFLCPHSKTVHMYCGTI